MDWRRSLTFDPIPPLLSSKNIALQFQVRRELLDTELYSLKQVWALDSARRLVAKQKANGAWKYPGGNAQIRSPEDYDQIETYRTLRELVEKHGMNREHPSIRRAADFLFSRQTEQGDFRGICGRQYVPYYSAAIMELLIKSGYSRDLRIRKGFDWLISIRQDDGGWAFPLRTVGRRLDTETFSTGTLEPDRSKPFSHLVTGMVLRAFAADPKRKMSPEAKHAGRLLASRFFKPDKYPDRRSPGFWTSFSFPFWFTDLLSSLDSLSLIGFDAKDPAIAKGLEWFAERQAMTGLWRLPLRIMAREEEPDSWISLAVCRAFKRLSV